MHKCAVKSQLSSEVADPSKIIDLTVLFRESRICNFMVSSIVPPVYDRLSAVQHGCRLRPVLRADPDWADGPDASLPLSLSDPRPAGPAGHRLLDQPPWGTGQAAGVRTERRPTPRRQSASCSDAKSSPSLTSTRFLISYMSM